VLMLDLATKWVTFSYTDREVTAEVYRERIYPLLRERSSRGTVDLPDPPVPDAPHTGHGPRRWMPYAGVETESGHAVAGLKFRFAYHDWLDNPSGYPEGSSITLFAVDVQAEEELNDVTVDSFTLLDIRSLTPPRPWASPLSWAAHVGVHASPVDRDHHRTEVRFASGFTRQVAGLTAYLMLENSVRWDTALEDHVAWEPGVAWGLFTSGRRVRAGLRGRELWGAWGVDGHRREAEADIRWGFGRDLFVGAKVSHQRELHQSRNLVIFQLGHTF